MILSDKWWKYADMRIETRKSGRKRRRRRRGGNKYNDNKNDDKQIA